jgi:RNA polymerase sigma-70 factor (ECF subfamily)
VAETVSPFHGRFVALYGTSFPRLFRYLDRLTGEPELAADLTQEALVRLYRRGELPDAPDAWLITVALNLLRSHRSTLSRRRRLLTLDRAERAHSDPPPSPAIGAEVDEIRIRVRRALDALPDRERQLLLLRAEGFSYRDLAVALELNEASVGTLLARARRAFQAVYRGGHDAS